MESLKALQRRKTVLKYDFTKLRDKIASESDSFDSVQIQLFQDKLRDSSTKLTENFEKIFELCEEKDMDKFLEECQELQESNDALLVKLLRLAEKLKRDDDSKARSNSPNEHERSKVGTDIKLPKLTLPVFSGNIEEWLSFCDLFQACVKSNEFLSGAQKLQYLRGALKGDALKLIQSLSITDANFDIAWELLSERYSNKKELVFALINKVLSFPNLRSEGPVQILSLVDTTQECIRLLETLEQKVEGFADTIFVFMMQSKLDAVTRSWWERSLNDGVLPTVEQLLMFLKSHARTLQAANVQTSKKHVQHKVTSFASLSQLRCTFCNNDHVIFKCSKFKALDSQKRMNFIKQNNLCFNCLSGTHSAAVCKSEHRCKSCGKCHHTLLHFEKRHFNNDNNSSAENHTTPAVTKLSAQAEEFSPSTPRGNVNHVSISEQCLFSCTHAKVQETPSLTSNFESPVLLCTAVIKVRDCYGRYRECRALLDPGSQASFITENCLQRLKLPREKARIQVTCLGSSDSYTQGRTDVVFKPRFDSQMMFSSSAFVISKIIGKVPQYSLEAESLDLVKDLLLADPLFYKSGPIDILLGVTASLPLFKGEVFSRAGGMVVNSELGWIVAGKFKTTEQSSSVLVNTIQLDTEHLIKRFWELESVPCANLLTKEEQACEEHYKSTVSRGESGRYIVSLPFRSSPTQLGDSKQLAVSRLKGIENKLKSKPDMHQEYKDFMQEYLELGHMEKVPNCEQTSAPTDVYYLPHHAVCKESSSTTRLRVVFDASAKTTTGISLNDLLMVGPRVQQELFPILLRFRSFPIALCADIEKMFRQINVLPSDTEYQRILWRSDPFKPIEEFRLVTVTYGTASAPYLSTRTLKQLAQDEKDKYPLASAVTVRDFYMDDLLTGAHSVQEARELSNQLLRMMESGGFSLRKWCSSSPAVLECIPAELRRDHHSLTFDREQSTKVLGIDWSPSTDNFSFSISSEPTMDNPSKRHILSVIARIFDPLGWLSPVVVYVKIFLQELWRYELSWDEELPHSLKKKWESFRENLHQISEVRIPRCAFSVAAEGLQIHGFCDASEKAYCAVVYSRFVSSDSCVKLCLLTAKTKVAPMKTVSLPRLELCAALLLANLLDVVIKCLEIPVENTFAWSDSSVALSWISSEPNRWQSFVANRVSKIQETLPSVQWQHVPGSENPADCATRGFLPADFVNCHLWFDGPEWLKVEPFIVPGLNESITDEALKEEKRRVVAAVTYVEELSVIPKFSSWSKLRRVTAWILRFIANCKNPSEKIRGFLSTEELNRATILIVKNVQAQCFMEEISCLKANKPIKGSSRIVSLSPFLDSKGILRVGGRLRNANLPDDHKHPMLLPRSHHVTSLILRHYHESLLHAGSQLLLSSLRQRFWIVCGRDAARRCVNRCVVCCRHKAKTAKQIMADLPSSRALPSRPFSKVGIDYAGPFLIKTIHGRRHRSVKCYICIFVCFATRAVHLETVSDLTAKCFLATLRRFVARRGKPLEIFSDCATCFTKASKELTKAFATIHRDEKISSFLSDQSIKWHFNPPSAPHFGGLWEAGVKSMKYHLKRTMGVALLTHEEFSTLIAQVEACLNSRPLCPVSTDPDDLSVLTPGHFLIGTSLTAVPEPNLTDATMTHLSRWQMTQKILQHFWKRWSSEYLTRLQQRPKWCQPQKNFAIGDLVLVKNENLPPLQWKLGRITKTYAGKDGNVRVVDLVTASGELKRPIVKLCALPV